MPLVIWLVKYLGWALVAAAAFQHLFLVLCYINFLPLQVKYFRALPHSLGCIFQYIFLSLMILNIMHHVHDCNRVLEVRRGLVVSIVLFPPTSLKDRVIKELELCSCGKKKFTILPQISHFHKFRNFSSIFATFETNCFFPINFMAGTCQEYSFSFLPVATR